MIAKSLVVIISLTLCVFGSEPVAFIKNLQGNATLKRGAASQPTQKGEYLFNGDRIETAKNANIGISFNDGTRVAVGPESLFVIDNYLFKPSQKTFQFDVNLSKGKTATASGMTGNAESPSMALDGNESTKWCQNIVSDKWLMIDLGSSMEICEYLVKHGGIESVNYITKDFKIQRLEETQWIDVDVITGNTLNPTSRSVTPFTAQKVRLYITNSGVDNAARIYEFQLFGHNTAEINEIISNEKPSIFISPNPVTTESFEVQLSGFNDDTEVLVTIADSNGREVYRSKRNNSSSLTLTLKNRISNGVFYVTVRGKQKVATKQLLGQ